MEYMPLFTLSRSSMRDDELRALRRSGTLCVVIAIPMAMLESHEGQALANHSQTLRGLAGRGGLSACEAVAILKNRRWKSMPTDQANAELLALLRAWEARS